MLLTSSSFDHGQHIPEKYAFCAPDKEQHARMSDNRNPQLSWSDVPAGTRSLVLLCVDSDVPTKPDDVNQEGRSVPADLPRGEFFHWVMVDIPTSVNELAEASCSEGIVARGKADPAGPEGSRQGQNDYTGCFSGDPEMSGISLGYDGPCPPWNDEILHHYHFVLYATDLDRCAVDGAFTGQQVRDAIKGHVLADATLTGTYSLNPAVG